MKLNRVTLREVRMNLVEPFETSFGKSTERRIFLIEVEADGDRKSTRLNSSHIQKSRMPSSA